MIFVEDIENDGPANTYRNFYINCGPVDLEFYHYKGGFDGPICFFWKEGEYYHPADPESQVILLTPENTLEFTQN